MQINISFNPSRLRLSAWSQVGLLAVAGSIFLTACGTTSGLQNTQGQSIASTQKFSKVIVQDFKLSIPEFSEKATSSKTYLPDQIATEIKKTGKFANVSRTGKPDADTLVINGVITKYKEGNPQLRLWIGMGAGSSFFEATVDFRDHKGGKIGTINVDKNSWALGGAIAAGQGPQSFMDGAADKIAEESAKLAK